MYYGNLRLELKATVRPLRAYNTGGRNLSFSFRKPYSKIKGGASTVSMWKFIICNMQNGFFRYLKSCQVK